MIDKSKLKWEWIDGNGFGYNMYRASIFGGWLIIATPEGIADFNSGHKVSRNGWQLPLIFVPDQDHHWTPGYNDED